MTNKVMLTILGIMAGCLFLLVGTCAFMVSVGNRQTEKQEAQARAVTAADQIKWDAMTPAEHLTGADSALTKAGAALTKVGAALTKADSDQIKVDHYQAIKHIAVMPAGTPGLKEMKAKLAKQQADIVEKENRTLGPHPPREVAYDAAHRNIYRYLKDPDSLKDLQILMPEPSSIKRGKVKCWKVPFVYRAKNSFGGYVVNRGTLWMKNGEVLEWTSN